MQQVYKSYDKQFAGVDFDVFFNCYSKHNRLLWERYRSKGVTKRELACQRFHNTFEELKLAGIDPADMNRVYLEEMTNHNNLIEGARDVLEYLKNRHYHLFIITNGFKEVQYKKLVNAGINHYFTKVFVSEDVKAPKPSAVIFEYAIKSSNARKAKSLVVGDDWETDIAGAMNFGMDAVYISEEEIDKRRIKDSVGFYWFSEIARLKEIL